MRQIRVSVKLDLPHLPTKSIRRNYQLLLLICKFIPGIRRLKFSKLSLDIFQAVALLLIWTDNTYNSISVLNVNISIKRMLYVYHRCHPQSVHWTHLGIFLFSSFRIHIMYAWKKNRSPSYPMLFEVGSISEVRIYYIKYTLCNFIVSYPNTLRIYVKLKAIECTFSNSL